MCIENASGNIDTLFGARFWICSVAKYVVIAVITKIGVLSRLITSMGMATRIKLPDAGIMVSGVFENGYARIQKKLKLGIRFFVLIAIGSNAMKTMSRPTVA